MHWNTVVDVNVLLIRKTAIENRDQNKISLLTDAKETGGKVNVSVTRQSETGNRFMPLAQFECTAGDC